MATITWCFAGWVGLGLAGCGSSGESAGPDGGVVWTERVISCSPWEREPIPGTELVLSKAALAGPSTSSALPRRIDGIESLEVDFAVELSGEDTYNLNTSMWIHATDAVTAGINPADIRNEIMVWFSDPADLAIGEYDGAVSLGGVDFDLWHVLNEPDTDITHTWTMLTYAARDDRQQASFDLKLVLDDAVERGYVERSHAVGGVELMSEIFGGSGELWLERFDVRVAP